jgi:phage integrase
MDMYKFRVIGYDSVTKDKTTRMYRVDYAYKTPDGKLHRTCKRGFALKKDANAWAMSELPNLVAEKGQDKPLAPPAPVLPKTAKRTKQSIEDMLFSELVEKYMKHSEIRKKETTCGTKESIINSKILPYFKDELVAEISVEDIEDWQDIILESTTKQGNPYSQTYIRTIRSQFTAIMNHAVNKLGLPFNPLDRADMIGEKDGDERAFWTLDQYKEFRKVIAEKPQYFYAFEVLFWTGMRMGEMLALKPNDIDFENLTIRIDETYTKFKGKNLMTAPKTKSSKRTIHIPQTLAEELKEYMDSIYGLEQDDRIFLITKSGLHREIDRGVDACNIPDICVHGLRHSFSSMAQSEEVKAAEIIVSTILGHSKKKTMTAKYSHAYEKDLIAVAERLNKLMEEIENV